MDPSAPEIRDMISVMLVVLAGGRVKDWHDRIGPVDLVQTDLDGRHSWIITPSSDLEELAVICNAVEVVRRQFPYAM
jgi:hypothetical protein